MRAALKKITSIPAETSTDVKDKKKGFYGYMSSKRKTRKSVGLLLNGNEGLVTEVLNALLTSVFNSNTGLQQSQAPETSGKVQGKVDLRSVEENQFREYLNKLDMCKAMALVGYMLRELTDIGRPLLIVLERS